MSDEKKKKKLSEVIKGLPLDEAVDLLGQACEYLLQICTDVKRGPVGPIGLTGADSQVPGPSGKDGRDGVTPSKEALAGLILEVLAANIAKFRGEPGKDSSVRGPKGDSPSKEELTKLIHAVIAEHPEKFRGERGSDGRAGFDSTVPGPAGRPPSEDELKSAIREVIAENPEQFRGERGFSGAVGSQGVAGRDSVSTEEVRALVLEIIGASADVYLKAYVAIKKELEVIAADVRFHRVHFVREEIVKRIQQHMVVS